MRPFVGLGALVGLVLVVAGCKEALTAPGSCPEYCPPASVRVVDSVLAQSISGDSAFAGFVAPGEAAGLQLVSNPGGAGGVTTSRAVLQFLAFPERVLLNARDTVTAAVTQTDSFTVSLPIRQRTGGVSGLALELYRLPVTVDSTVAFGDLDALFVDSARIGTVSVPDPLGAGTVTGVLPPDVFPTLEADGRQVTVGVGLRSAAGAFVTLGAAEGGEGARLNRFVQVDSAGTDVARAPAGRPIEFDTFVAPPRPVPGAGVLQVGGVPAARAMMRVALPGEGLDSGSVVRATLILVPTEAAPGAPGDSIRLVAQGVAADVGAKSPLIGIAPDSVAARLTTVLAGATDTIQVDITDIVRAWVADDELPRMLALRAEPEGAGFLEVRFGSTAFPGAAPIIRLTFVPPVGLGGT